jgi:IrrE N-terminal-like domain
LGGDIISINFRRLRRRCAAIASRLPLPVPFDVRELCRLVADERGKPILLMPSTGSAKVMGLWVATASADIILYEQTTTPPHQEHIILHELSHLLCQHYRGALPDTEHIRALLPNLDPSMIRRVLGRTEYSAEEEQEAELLASMIKQRAERAVASDGASSTLDDRVSDALFWSDRDRDRDG